MDDYDVLYIGNESHTLTNMMMTFNKCTFHTYNPQINHCRVENISVNKKLMKRYYLVERTKDANIVGIVVATLGVSDYISSINRLKEIIRLAGKKSYTFVMGKLNVAKLANFMEVDIYVIVACPENSLLDNSEFYRPVITPYELEIALNPDRDWTGEYTSDFRDLLPGIFFNFTFFLLRNFGIILLMVYKSNLRINYLYILGIVFWDDLKS